MPDSQEEAQYFVFVLVSHPDTLLWYWVLAVVPYLLWAFCTNHTLEECERIFKARKLRLVAVAYFAELAPRFQSRWLCGIKLLPRSSYSFGLTLSSTATSTFSLF
ncbi:hypothetical protein PHLCEN_2v2763 [Hermanssonia centrifuga]|uniref:Uncharacterized protein n=1 Tax=Hermanssonia centrifuga TaxID=98765 RepID=A0A2R6RHW5_9APHY|nr:hypothetical protein PHLCEN_2v2763 [Hermanssonia centrifuga]